MTSFFLMEWLVRLKAQIWGSGGRPKFTARVKEPSRMGLRLPKRELCDFPFVGFEGNRFHHCKNMHLLFVFFRRLKLMKVMGFVGGHQDTGFLLVHVLNQTQDWYTTKKRHTHKLWLGVLF